MHRALMLVVVGIVSVVPSVASAQPALKGHPIVGAWALNVARSTGASVRLTVTAGQSGQVEMKMMGLSASFRLDGKEHPTFGVMASWARVGNNAWDAVVRDNGKTTSIDHYLLSADDQILTIRTETPGRANAAAEALVLKRASGGPGLAGVWQGRRSVGDAKAEYAIDNGRLRIHVSPSEERWLGTLDGKDYPWQTPGAEPGRLTATGQLVDARTIQIVLKEKGVAFQFATLSVSADGRTLRIDQVHGTTPDAPERSRLVFERQ
jgi:hypothetical protein